MPEANVFHLDGQNLHIDYATTSVTGQPIFNYHDAQRTLTFTADQIQAVETDAGTLVSVTIRKTRRRRVDQLQRADPADQHRVRLTRCRPDYRGDGPAPLLARSFPGPGPARHLHHHADAWRR